MYVLIIHSVDEANLGGHVSPSVTVIHTSPSLVGHRPGKILIVLLGVPHYLQVC